MTAADRQAAFSEALRVQIVEAMSWSEDFDNGRMGTERARALLDKYTDRLCREAAAEALEEAADVLQAGAPTTPSGTTFYVRYLRARAAALAATEGEGPR